MCFERSWRRHRRLPGGFSSWGRARYGSGADADQRARSQRAVSCVSGALGHGACRENAVPGSSYPCRVQGASGATSVDVHLQLACDGQRSTNDRRASDGEGGGGLAATPLSGDERSAASASGCPDAAASGWRCRAECSTARHHLRNKRPVGELPAVFVSRRDLDRIYLGAHRSGRRGLVPTDGSQVTVC